MPQRTKLSQGRAMFRTSLVPLQSNTNSSSFNCSPFCGVIPTPFTILFSSLLNSHILSSQPETAFRTNHKTPDLSDELQVHSNSNTVPAISAIYDYISFLVTTNIDSNWVPVKLKFLSHLHASPPKNTSPVWY